MTFLRKSWLDLKFYASLENQINNNKFFFFFLFSWNSSTKVIFSPSKVLWYTLEQDISDNRAQNSTKDKVMDEFNIFDINDICWEFCDVIIFRWRICGKKFPDKFFLNVARAISRQNIGYQMVWMKSWQL